MRTASPAVGGVVLVEPAAQPPRFDADNRVDARVVLLVAVEHFHADRVLLQLIGLAGQRPLDDVAEQPAEATSVREAARCQHALELGPNLFARNGLVVAQESENPGKGCHPDKNSPPGKSCRPVGEEVTVTSTVTCFKSATWPATIAP
jgi:hypothetical protein